MDNTMSLEILDKFAEIEARLDALESATGLAPEAEDKEEDEV